MTLWLHCTAQSDQKYVQQLFLLESLITLPKFKHLMKIQMNYIQRKNVHLVELNGKFKDISSIAGKLSKDFFWLCFSYKKIQNSNSQDIISGQNGKELVECLSSHVWWEKCHDGSNVWNQTEQAKTREENSFTPVFILLPNLELSLHWWADNLAHLIILAKLTSF